MGWEDGAKANREITQHTSAEVFLASFHDVIPHALFEMNVWKVVTDKRKSQWAVRWDVKETINLPCLNVRLTIASKGQGNLGKSTSFLSLRLQPDLLS
jgi:hypothetical protein